MAFGLDGDRTDHRGLAKENELAGETPFATGRFLSFFQLNFRPCPHRLVA